ncbi:DUF4160 domain-containing protein [Pantanalinema rosaneae CENA516]|uniref:DUF4160 domain-containing protein n=1 Tax=Pantanalinema rosaneae TaxID=1620701 RepID=UPI003D6EA768
MPTVHREDGFRIVIYPNDHLPRHVHVFKADGEVIIQLGSDTEAPLIDQVYGDISNKNIAKALQLVQIHQMKLLAAWREIHG